MVTSSIYPEACFRQMSIICKNSLRYYRLNKFVAELIMKILQMSTEGCTNSFLSRKDKERFLHVKEFDIPM